MPPLAWSLQPDDAQAMLTALASTIHAGLAVPRPLTAVIAEANAVPPQDLAPLPDGALGNPRGRFDDGVVSGIAAVTGRLWGLTSALTTDQRTGLTGAQYTAPLREDMLRALSQSVPPDARNGLAQQRLTTVGSTVERPVRRGHHRQPRRFLHAGHRAQPAAAGAAQRPARADPGPAAGRRAARDVGDRYG